ncbi:MAG: ribonuclease HII [Crocinitomix sp.]|nr:ribonuclease HII [Crocinitomix sp.]
MGLKTYFEKGKIEAGCDEAGRGCLAGPVVAASVILPKGFRNSVLNDSKQLSEKKREMLAPIIMDKAIAYGIGVVDHLEIDKINILNASFEAMHRAIRALSTTPESLLIDGNRFNPYAGVQHHCIIKGDAKYMAIAAASVLAKTFRDHLMAEYHVEYPQYDWNQNKGYPTKKHRQAIFDFGATPLHRKSFKLLSDEQLRLFDDVR